MSDVQNIIQSFTAQLTAVIEAQALAQARSAVFAALGGSGAVARRRGRPPNALRTSAVPHLALPKAPAKKPRKKAPLQLCPVPGCKNPAAPVFGMVCAKHKDLPKTKIKKFREERKAKRLKADGVTAPKKRVRRPGRPKTAKAPKAPKKRGRKPGRKPAAPGAGATSPTTAK
jgi:hypothetical protein